MGKHPPLSELQKCIRRWKKGYLSEREVVDGLFASMKKEDLLTLSDECPEALLALLKTEVSRFPKADKGWDGFYLGTVSEYSPSISQERIRKIGLEETKRIRIGVELFRNWLKENGDSRSERKF
ncbi:hypothetical protein [Rubellicoccus peritrichatus]|uniref:Uncharacterized protein n=1 Tax=Rubellicoccus peritrichatus TaxID=3080537 RepID=A0AAQ3LBC7_9BACT|nr:hypothetical protein [Puniceicoccus sp. CR14]WOO40348.1 hypothetical protein RZN69_17150 [Puniceicoccus sp. CR14]